MDIYTVDELKASFPTLYNKMGLSNDSSNNFAKALKVLGFENELVFLESVETIGCEKVFCGEYARHLFTAIAYLNISKKLPAAVSALSAEPTYFILPETQDKVADAVFVIVEENEDGVHKGVGMGVFFSRTLAVTCDHNLTAEHTVGSLVPVQLKNEMADVEVVARNPALDFAILKASKPRSFIAPWNGNPDHLGGYCDLVLASYRLGIDHYQEPYKGSLGFAPAACIPISHHRRHILYSCPAYAGDSGAALILKGGLLVGIHLATTNALRKKIERKKAMEEPLDDVEEYLDMILRSRLARGCLGLLVREFKNVVV